MTRVLLVDNYDSFTYNVVQALEVLGAKVEVRTHELSVEQAAKIEPTHLVISPGPGRPDGAGNSLRIVAAFHEKLPILGICLGHQTLAQFFGASIGQAQTLRHGKTSQVYHDNIGCYEGIPNPFDAGRYHSLAVEDHSLPDSLTISSYTSEGEIMGIRHRELPIEGVQFHPESILTPTGDRMLRNFLDTEANGS